MTSIQGHAGLLLTSTSSNAFSAFVLSLGPYAYWRLNDTTTTAVDSSGNAQDATWATNGGTYTQSQASILPNGSGASTGKTGDSNASRVFTAPTIGVAPVATWTIAAMIKPSSFPSTANVILSAGIERQQLSLDSSGHLVAGRAAIANYTTSTGIVSVGSAYLVAVSLDGTGAGSYYINGVNAGNITGASPCPSPVGTTGRIGTYYNGLGFPFVGNLQELIFIASNLTPTQHAALWAAAQ